MGKKFNMKKKAEIWHRYIEELRESKTVTKVSLWKTKKQNDAKETENEKEKTLLGVDTAENLRKQNLCIREGGNAG